MDFSILKGDCILSPPETGASLSSTSTQGLIHHSLSEFFFVCDNTAEPLS